jgi:putative nucleotidyltransferase with HDIG domain
MMNTVLFVDNEKSILNSIDSIFIDSDIRVLKADTAQKALDIISQESIAVIVSDNQVPGMNGNALLSRINEISPDTVRVMITGYADLQTAVDALNSGEIFRFIIKPCQNDSLIKAVQEALEQYWIIHSLRSTDENTLLSLAEAVELKDGYTRGHCQRVAEYALIIASEINMSGDSVKAIRRGSWLHDCGKIGVPEDILNKNGPLDPEEFEIIKNHPKWGADAARKAALSRPIYNIIHFHHERYDGSGYPAGLKEDEIPFEVRIVTVADVYDALTSDRPYRDKYSIDKAIDIMRIMRGTAFDPDILDLFLDMCVQITK